MCKTSCSEFDVLGLEVCKHGTLEEITYAEITSPSKSLVAQEDFCYDEVDYGRQKEGVANTQDEPEQSLELGAVYYGIAMHYMLEMCAGLDATHLHNAYLLTKNRYGLLVEERSLRQIQAKIAELLAHPIFVSLAQGKLSMEQPILYHGEIKRVDLVCEQENRIVVIDYKSGKGDAEANHAQVAYYVQALEGLYTKPVEGYLCYLQEEIQIVRV